MAGVEFVWGVRSRLAFSGMMSGLLLLHVVDRIAVTVGNQVITETEILRDIALTAFLNGEKPFRHRRK